MHSFFLPALSQITRNYYSLLSPFLKMSSSPVAIYVTVPNNEIGKRICYSVIDKKLAGCVNIIPGVTSIYRWEGKVRVSVNFYKMLHIASTVVNLKNIHRRILRVTLTLASSNENMAIEIVS